MVLGTYGSFYFVNTLQFLSDLSLQVSSLMLVPPGLLDDLRSALNHQHLSIYFFLSVSVPLHIVQTWLESLNQWRQAPLA